MRQRQPVNKSSLRPPINRSHVLSFFLGVLCSWCLMRESPAGEPRARSIGLGFVQDDEQNSNSNNLPNHFDASKIVPHAKALNDAMAPGRGYQPDEQRSKTWLPETMGSYWWLNNCHNSKKETVSMPEAFGIVALNMTYPKSYFSGGKGHPGGKGPTDLAYLKYIHRYAGLVRGREVQSLVEFGIGGGPFAAHWHRLYPDQFVTVEGSGAGCALAVERGVPRERVVQHDLRHPLYLGRRFHVAVCTKVVEHVEPPFATQIVLNLVVHADVVWFSFKTAAGRNRAWINHPNERPLTLWTNLFDFYGYNIVPFHLSTRAALNSRGDFVAYKRGSDELRTPGVSYETLVEHTDDDVLNRPKQQPQPKWTFVLTPCENLDPSAILWRGPSASDLCAIHT